MTIDERLDRLTDRHEALTQSVELLVVSGNAQNERLSRLEDMLERLIRVVASHENRIGGLEGGVH